MQDFDPYYVWLSIPPNEQPPNHYRLLGIPLLEPNPDVIESAADRQMQHLRTFQSGPHGVDSQRLLNEVSKAKICLLNPPQKQEYDQQLRMKLAPPPVPAVRAALPAAAPVPFVAQTAGPIVASSQPLMASRGKSKNSSPLVAVWVCIASIAALVLAVVWFKANQPDSVVSSPEVSRPKHQGPIVEPHNDLAANDAAEPPGKTSSPPVVDTLPAAEQIANRANESDQRTTVASSAEAKPLNVDPTSANPLSATPPVVPPQLVSVAPVSLNEWVDLLAWTEGVDWAPRGLDWNSHLESPATKAGIALKPLQFIRFPLAAIIDGDYDMAVEFTRHTGSEGVIVFFPVGDHNLLLEIGAFAETVGGVGWIDGKLAFAGNETTRRPWPISNGQKHRVQIRVRRDGEKAAFDIDWDDQKDFIRWSGPYNSLTNVAGDAWKLSMIRHPWIGNWDNRVTFSKVHVRMKSGTIRRDVITEADRAADRKQGFVRLVGEQATLPSVGWAQFLVNQAPLEAGPGECERVWPLIAREFTICQDYYGAHAPSRLKCPIPKAAKSFTAIGYNDASRTTKFIVFVDGKQVYDSGVTHLAAINLNLPAGSAALELVVDSLGDIGFDHSYWCYPRFHTAPLDKVTDKKREEKVPQLPFKVASHTQHSELTHKQPLGGLFSVPLNARSVVPCDEFLFAHANSTVTYAVPDGMTRFSAIGYCLRSNSVKFEVWADAKRLDESPQAGIIPIDVKLPRGAKTIELKVNSLGNNGADGSIWCYPRLHAK